MNHSIWSWKSPALYFSSYCYHLYPETKSQNDEKRLKLDDLSEVRVSTGGKAPRKQLACRPGDFHKRVRETSGNPSSESGARIIFINPLFINRNSFPQ